MSQFSIQNKAEAFLNNKQYNKVPKSHLLQRHFSEDTDIDKSLLEEHPEGRHSLITRYSHVTLAGQPALMNKGKVKQADADKLHDDLEMIYIRRRRSLRIQELSSAKVLRKIEPTTISRDYTIRDDIKFLLKTLRDSELDATPGKHCFIDLLHEEVSEEETPFEGINGYNLTINNLEPV
ncbi:unnamed protein product [Moneuplotes crassus]|uniref:Uncharacterized protein n=1 Tax=Euplotes crassus TaxID=5936 RepID=A0AAD1XYT4_EUPCR|nr:unnamed protein product [Moneuplotes crassus]